MSFFCFVQTTNEDFSWSFIWFAPAWCVFLNLYSTPSKRTKYRSPTPTKMILECTGTSIHCKTCRYVHSLCVSLLKEKIMVQICKWLLWKLYFDLLYIVGSDQRESEHSHRFVLSLMLHINGFEGSYCPRDHTSLLSTMQLMRGLSLYIYITPLLSFSVLEDNHSLLNPLILLTHWSNRTRLHMTEIDPSRGFSIAIITYNRLHSLNLKSRNMHLFFKL